jgi:arylsulfatase A-like enzyme
VITVDTLRADRLDAAHMPHLAAFARGATVFTHAYAQAPNTPRSFPSFLTSRYPSRVHWERQGLNFSPILPDNLTLFEVLHQAGLRTVGEFSHFYADPKTGISQGFDEWHNDGALTLHDSNTDIAAPRITARVKRRLKELAAKKTRFAMWTHLFEPHSRYMDHAGIPVHGVGFKQLESKYDGEVAFVDQHLQAIFDELRADGLDDDTVVVVFADHGESFGEHRFGGQQMFLHGETLYDEALRVPLLFRVPGQPGRTVDGRVQLVDLGPTLVDLVGVPVPAAFEGRSLRTALEGAQLAPAPVYAELLPATSWNHSWRVLIDGDLKLINKISENSVELYDLARDPGEQKNLSSQAADVKRLKDELRRFPPPDRSATASAASRTPPGAAHP